MSPLLKLSKTSGGKVEITPLQGTEAVQVCIDFDGQSIADVYFVQGKSSKRFYLLGLDDVVSVTIGLHNGEAWYLWNWMWESGEEANEAWSKVRDGQADKVELLTEKINSFISDAANSEMRRQAKVSLNISDDLTSIGWQVTILEQTKKEIDWQYNHSKRVNQLRNSNQRLEAATTESSSNQKKAWWKFWRK